MTRKRNKERRTQGNGGRGDGERKKRGKTGRKEENKLAL